MAGPLVPREDWEAAAAGVFRRAVVLSHPDGLWITFLRSGKDMEARGFWPGSRAFEALAARARPGDAVRFLWGSPCRVLLGALELELPPLRAWDPRPGILRSARRFRRSGPEGIRRALRLLEAALESGGPSEGIHGAGPFGTRFRALRGEKDFPFCLVGFGPGTTPAGDDFLAGWLLGRALRNGGTVPDASGLPDLSRTTAAGRTLLAGAREGVFPAYLARVARALAEEARGGRTAARHGDGDALPPDIRGALGHGATSGRDALAGLLSGIGEP